VAGREVEVGRAGAVATRQIRWNQEAGTGRYLLQVLVTE
jgi:hypothetical protein